jgi:acyl-CoA reductase-like NAD-dependent aldehyde dehydrogenase
MKMFVAGQWVDRPGPSEVRNPYDGTVIDTVPKATPADVEQALACAVEGARQMRRMPGYERYQILHRAGRLLAERQEKLGRIISTEEGKTLADGHFEAGRAVQTLELSAEEAKRLGAKYCRSTAHRRRPATWASRCGSPAAWSWPSRRSTFP